jgi:hypothetical protein
VIAAGSNGGRTAATNMLRSQKVKELDLN